MMKERIGVAVIAKNEADRIGRLLQSVSFADRILVVDSGSSDGTQEICRRAGATVIQQEWMGYAAQKQFAMDQLDTEWILSLDADEAVSPELAGEIQLAVSHAEGAISGFSMPRLSKYLGRWIYHGGWYPDRKVRLIRRGKARWSQEALHERLLLEGPIRELKNPIFHFVYRDISDHVATIDRFSDIYAQDRGQAGALFLLAGLPHTFGKWIECYFLKLGFLDGLPGLVIAMNSAWYVFLKHAKAWALGASGGGVKAPDGGDLDAYGHSRADP
jgi:glycosyltransferase involved in cell wall biosynthesis